MGLDQEWRTQKPVMAAEVVYAYTLKRKIPSLWL